MSIPKVFISYSHDTLDHKKWVLDLATKLRSSGVDASIDQWDLRPGDDLSHFMETNLVSADRVLMVCTEKYVEKANAGLGGVGYEKMIVTADSLAKISSNKVIPIIRQTLKINIPTFLRTKLYLDFSKPEQFEFAFDELVRTIHNSPLYEKPPITKTNSPVNFQPAKPTTDNIKEVMKIAVNDYELGNRSISKEKLLQELNISRILLDLLLNECVNKKYLNHDPYRRNYYLADAGKMYAVENNLIK